MKPYFFTEIGATGRYSYACRVATIANCVMDATENEGNLNANERHRGKAARLALIKKGWAKFLTLGDDNGWMDQGDVVAVHRKMFPGLPDPIVTRESPADVWDAIPDYAISLAIYPGEVGPGNPIRKWVGAVPHQGKIAKRMSVNGVRYVKWVCPMHPGSDTFVGVWVKWADLRKCAQAIQGANGEMFVELFPKGDWTRAKLATAQKQRVIRALRDEVDTLDATLTKRDDRILHLVDKVDGLEAKLADCDDNEAARLAALDQAQEAVHDAIEALKGDAA